MIFRAEAPKDEMTSRDDSPPFAPTIGATGTDATLAAGGSTFGADSRAPSPAPSRQDAVLAGRYRIVGLLGSGGMGAVYRARDLELDEEVALKMLRGELVDSAEALGRFRNEVKLARRVTHRNVARTFDIAEHEGARFLTMELVRGRSLASALEVSRRPALAVVRDVVEQVAAGLAAAHAVDVVHRDLKPDNVILAEDGRVVLTDFGIAHAHDAGGHRHTVGGFVGTPAYMAPEQVDGSGHCDGRTDLYAFGAMTFELLAGEAAWSGPSPLAVAVARLTNDPPDLLRRRPELRHVATVVRRAMARAPGDRFSTVVEYAAAFVRALELDAEPSKSAATVTMPASSGAPPEPSPSRAPTPTSVGGLAAPTATRSLAVVPLRNAGSPDDAYLAEGLTEDLVDALSMMPGLRVASRGAVARVLADASDATALARALGVEAVVEGSVRRAGDRLRVTARIVSANDGFQLWAERFDRPAGDALVVSDLVANAVRDALTLREGGVVRSAPTNPEAVELYLRGRAIYRRDRPEESTLAVELLARAVALAPQDPQILAAAALAYNRVAQLRHEHGADDRGAALALAEQAAALAPQLPDVHVALGAVELRSGSHRSAIRCFRRALRIKPDHADALGYLGRVLLEVGELEQAVRMLERTLTIDPETRGIARDLARGHALLGRWNEARALLERAATSEGSGVAYDVARSRLAAWEGDRETVLRVHAELQKRDYSGGLRVFVVCAGLAALQDDDARARLAEARAVLVAVTSSAPTIRMLAGQVLTEAASGLGDTGLARDALDFAIDAGLVDRNWLERCPALATLRAQETLDAQRAIVVARAEEAARGLVDPLDDGRLAIGNSA